MNRSLRLMLGVALPLALVGLGFYFAPRSGFGKGAVAQDHLIPGQTYALWISEAYLADKHSDGRSWDMDGSGPDIRGDIYWRDLKVLSTDVSRDNIVARWEAVSVDLRTVFLGGKVGSSQIHNVAMIKPEQNDFLTVRFYDEDPLDEEFAGGITISATGLVAGLNRISFTNGTGEIRSIQLASILARPDKGVALEENTLVVDYGYPVQWLEPTAGASAEAKASELSSEVQQAIMDGSRALDQTIAEGTKMIQQGAQEFIKEMDRAVRELQGTP